MPEKVPFFVLVTQLIYRIASLLKSAFRGLTVLIVWLIILPNFTLWTWRFYFWSGENIGFNTHVMDATSTATTTTTTAANDTLAEQQQDQQQESSFFVLTLKGFLSDCLEGQIITAFVIIIFVAAYLFREWVMQNLPAEQPNIAIEENLVNQLNNNNNAAHANNNDQLVGDQFAIDTLLNAMQVINPPNENNVNVGDDQEQRMRRQLHQLRVELENEMAERNYTDNQSHAWSPSLNDRVVHDDEDQLFGGVDGIGAVSAAIDNGHASSSSAAVVLDENDEEYPETGRYNLRSNSHRRMNQHQMEQPEAEEEDDDRFRRFNHRHSPPFDQDQVVAEDTWPSINQFDEDEWEDDNSLPDLVHRPEHEQNPDEAIIDNLRERFGGPMNDPIINAFEREMRNRRQRDQQQDHLLPPPPPLLLWMKTSHLMWVMISTVFWRLLACEAILGCWCRILFSCHL